MDMEGLSAICAGLGMVEEDEKGNRISYYKGEYCLGEFRQKQKIENTIISLYLE